MSQNVIQNWRWSFYPLAGLKQDPIYDLIKTCSLKATDGGMAGVVADDGDDTQRFQCFPLTRWLWLQHCESASISLARFLVDVVIVLPSHLLSILLSFHLRLLWQHFHSILIFLASFLLWATPPSTCSVLTSRELRFRLKSHKNKQQELVVVEPGMVPK